MSEEKARRRALQEGKGLRRALEGARGFPVEECVISTDWRETGLAHILVARRGPSGTLVVGGYYVDTLCLGLKDTAVIRDVSKEEYEQKVKPNVFKDQVVLEACEPGVARFVVEGAISFAGRFGFKPNKRWDESKMVLKGIEIEPDAVAFGREGRPCYVVRKGENPEPILKRLERYAGRGQYTVVDPGSEEVIA